MNLKETISSAIQTEHPARLSHRLRSGSSKYLKNRRGIVVTSLVASASMGLVSLYQTGVIDQLPEPPLPHLNSEKVDGSAQAYARLDMPDGPIGLRSYAATLSLAAMGSPDRVEEKPWLPLALLGKVLIDAGQAGKLSLDQWRNHRALCIWCLLAAVATFISVPLAVPEALQAMRNMLGNES